MLYYSTSVIMVVEKIEVNMTLVLSLIGNIKIFLENNFYFINRYKIA